DVRIHARPPARLGFRRIRRGGGAHRRGRQGLLCRGRCRGGRAPCPEWQARSLRVRRCLLHRRVRTRLPPAHLSEAAGVLLARHQHGRRGRALGRGEPPRGRRWFPHCHAGDPHRAVPGRRRRLVPQPHAGRDGTPHGPHRTDDQRGGRDFRGPGRLLRAARGARCTFLGPCGHRLAGRGGGLRRRHPAARFVPPAPPCGPAGLQPDAVLRRDPFHRVPARRDCGPRRTACRRPRGRILQASGRQPRRRVADGRPRHLGLPAAVSPPVAARGAAARPGAGAPVPASPRLPGRGARLADRQGPAPGLVARPLRGGRAGTGGGALPAALTARGPVPGVENPGAGRHLGHGAASPDARPGAVHGARNQERFEVSQSMSDTSTAGGQASPAEKQTLGFQTEVRQLLHLMIHSLYGNREIFLRELISNASDACDKLRFEALDSPELLGEDAELAIRIDYDREARTIRVIDNGIGMSREEAIANLGTIARSGTREFFGQLSGDKARDAQLIGQFGVGFYSAFMVAERVVVLSRRAGAPAEQGVRWESDGTGEFTVETIERPQRGTEVILHLRPAPADADGDSPDELLNGWRLRSIVRKYSDHVSLPILMRKEGQSKDGDKGEEEWETVNQASALWSRPKSELGDEDYKAFYRNLGLDGADPLAWTHNRVEGRTEYTQLLFIPSKAPFDIWDREHRHGIKLYVRRVFIMDDAEQLLPAYLPFLRGVIDSADLPLNVSREILQESRDVKAIREGNVRRVLGMLEDLVTNKPDAYRQFWSEFGQVLKEG